MVAGARILQIERIVMLRILLISILFATAALPAQERQVTSPFVEVVSVKENKSGERSVAAARSGAPGRFGASNMTLRLLINAAYGGIPTSRIFGGPDWTDTVRFDVEGIGDPTRPSIFTAVQDQLGLKLESTKAPLDVIVIEHAERPKEN